jgi:hypothetical protein
MECMLDIRYARTLKLKDNVSLESERTLHNSTICLSFLYHAITFYQTTTPQFDVDLAHSTCQ